MDQIFDIFLLEAVLVGLIGSLVRLFQTGYLYHYALVMILGVLALMTWFVFMQH